MYFFIARYYNDAWWFFEKNDVMMIGRQLKQSQKGVLSVYCTAASDHGDNDYAAVLIW